MSEFRFDPATYVGEIRADIPVFDELQEQTALATDGVEAREILELGVGTGMTSRWVLARHPGARLVGFEATTTWTWNELAVVRADLPG